MENEPESQLVSESTNQIAEAGQDEGQDSVCVCVYSHAPMVSTQQTKVYSYDLCLISLSLSLKMASLITGPLIFRRSP